MMPTSSPLPDALFRRIAIDHHAAHRLSLLKAAQAARDGTRPLAASERYELAERLERWRYQTLAEKNARLSSEDEQLLDFLAELAAALYGSAGCGLRKVREAIRGDHSADLSEAMAALDPLRAVEEVEGRAAALTAAHFALGRSRRRMLLYAPLYLSNHCINYCAYCGFRHPQEVERKHLDAEEAVRQAAILQGRGFSHVLLVAGDFPHLTTSSYFAEIIGRITALGMQPAVEIAPQSVGDYRKLVEAGARGVTLYQETYHRALYAEYHPRGTKRAFDWRLEGLDRAGEAGAQRLGLGILLGLADPASDLASLIRHGQCLVSRFPDRMVAFSLPRIRDAAPGFRPHYAVDDELFVRMYCALRIAFPQSELVLSTRESASLRGRLAKACITQMSAGSSTSPGGYEAGPDHAGEQFPVRDHRSAAEVAEWLDHQGFDVRWSL